MDGLCSGTLASSVQHMSTVQPTGDCDNFATKPPMSPDDRLGAGDPVSAVDLVSSPGYRSVGMTSPKPDRGSAGKVPGAAGPLLSSRAATPVDNLASYPQVDSGGVAGHVGRSARWRNETLRYNG